MKILIIGGAGFIGSWLTQELVKRGHEVTVLDSMVKGQMGDRIEGTVRSFRKDLRKGSKLANGDLREIGNGVFLTDRPEIVIHLAATPLEKPFDDEMSRKQLSSDIELTYEAVTLSKKHGVKKFIYMSSLFAYGDIGDNTYENHPLNPKTAYGISKAAGEFIVKSQMDNWNIIRTTSVYGFGDLNNRVTQILINRAITGEDGWVNNVNLDFIYIKDLVKGIADVTLSDKNNEVFHISGGSAMALTAYASLVKLAFHNFHYETKELNDRPTRGTLENDKARKLLGWEKEYSLVKGFEDYLFYVKEYGFA